MIRNRFEELKLAGQLPSPTGVGLSILRITAREDYSVHELVQTIRVDPALTGRLLMLANSALKGGIEPATSAQVAALRLGTRAVRNVVLGFSLVSSQRSGACSAFDYDLYWSHSIACASAARLLAGEEGQIDPAEAFTCALLARIGLLALVSVHPEAMSEILSVKRSTSVGELLRAESNQFHIQHWEVGAAMLAEWGLPEHFGNALLMLGARAEGAEVGDAPTNELAVLLRRASTVANRLVLHVPQSAGSSASPQCRLALEVSGQHEVDETELARACERAAPEWQQWGREFNLPTCASECWSASPASSQTASSETNLEPTHEVADAAPGLSVLVAGVATPDEGLLVRVLSAQGYRVLTAQGYELCVRLALQEQPDIVIYGRACEGSDGADLCRTLRRSAACRRAYCVFLAGREEDLQAFDAVAADADDQLVAPLDPRVIVARAKVGARMIELQRLAQEDRSARMRDAAQVGLLTRQLHAAAVTDVLTKLPNRRYALLRLQEEWAAAVRLDRPLSIVVGDVDRFRTINESYGQALGDEVLAAAARVMQARTRRADVLCRLDGDEFLVVSTSSDLSGAHLCAERLRRAVESHPLEVSGFEGPLTLSFGCAQREHGIDSLDALLARAHEATRAAKAAGRNCTMLWQEPRSRAG